MIEARIKRLENELSKKLQKISPEREVLERRVAEEPKKPTLKSKYTDSPQKVHKLKEKLKNESISPKHKKGKREDASSSNPQIASSKYVKKNNESYQMRTIEENRPTTKANNRKHTAQSYQSQKEPNYKHIIEELKKENEHLKGKISSKSKKKSYLEKDLEDMDDLKSKIGSQEMTKLEKEIELLKILESIRSKLKRSINHKLNKLYPEEKISNKGRIGAFLLHHGCPANYLN